MPKDIFDKLKDLPPDKQLFYLKVKELELKEIELRQKQKDENKQWWQNPLYLAAFGLIGNIIISYINSNNQQKIERDKVNSSAIIEAIKTGDTATAKNNLKFLLGIGFLNDEDGNIKKYLDSTSNFPVLPSSGTSYEQTYPYLRTDTISSNSSLYKISKSVGLLKVYNGNKMEMSGTAVALDDNTVIFPRMFFDSSSKYKKVTFTLDYTNLTDKGEEIELVLSSSDSIRNSKFYYFKSKHKFLNNLSQYEKVPPKINQEILIIQHPYGSAKVIASDETCKIINVSDKSNTFNYNCKTSKGSGGGLIITTDFKVIGLHIGKNEDGSKFGTVLNYIKTK